ncbi:MAG: hypothetical protein ACFFBP_09115 [Promethearchaeota archaeon]
MNPRIKEVADGVAQLITNFFNIPLNAAKGISWLTVKEWQTKSHTLHGDLINMSQTERDNAVKEILDIYKQRLIRLLNDPEEQKQNIDEVMNKVWDIYKAFEKKRKK